MWMVKSKKICIKCKKKLIFSIQKSKKGEKVSMSRKMQQKGFQSCKCGKGKKQKDKKYNTCYKSKNEIRCNEKVKNRIKIIYLFFDK